MVDLPYNASAEAAVIGSILYDNTQYHRVRDALTPNAFYVPANAVLWAAVVQLLSQGRSADALTVRAHLEASGEFEQAGGGDYLAEVYDCAAFGPEIGDYGRIVKESYTRRRAIEAGHALASEAKGGKIEEVIDAHDKALEELRNDATGETNARDLQELTIARLVNPNASADRIIPTGFPSIDSEIGGFERGAFSVIGARPGMGKTAFAVSVSGNQMRLGHTVGFFSLEMPDTDIGLRLGCSEAHAMDAQSVPFYSDLIRGRASPEQVGYLKQAMEQGHMCRFLCDDRGALRIADMKRQYRFWQRQCRMRGIDPPSVVYVDHIGHARPDENTTRLYERVTYVSNALLALAKEFDIAVVGLSQLSRASVEGDKEPSPPSLHHLRESGAIEQDASLVILLHRRDYYLRKMADNGVDGAVDALRVEQGRMACLIEKARNGSPGRVNMKHRIGHNVFLDPATIDRRDAA